VTFARIADPIIAAKGSTRALIAFLAGAASTLGLAPINLWPALFVTFPILVWLIDGATAADWSKPVVAPPTDDPLPARARAAIEDIKKNVGIAQTPPQASRLAQAWRHIRPAAAIGWWFGFGYFIAGLYWLGFALLVDAASYAWFLPFAIIGVPAGLAIFTSFGVVLARLVWSSGALRILALAAGLTVAEWLRGHVLTGFPWNTYGYALTGSLWLAQASALVGIWMLTLIAVAAFASPAVLVDSRASLRARCWLPAGAAVVLAAFALFGASRLAAMPTRFVEGVELRLMQPNLPEDETSNYSAREEVMRRYIALSRRPSAQRPNGMADVTHLVWPESAFPFFLAYEGKALADITSGTPTTRSMCSTTTSRCAGSTTRCISCHLASTCRFRTSWKAWGYCNSPRSAAATWRASNTNRWLFQVRRRRCRSSVMRSSFQTKPAPMRAIGRPGSSTSPTTAGSV
jgi:apolipoprotein N-acyltransferase